MRPNKKLVDVKSTRFMLQKLKKVAVCVPFLYDNSREQNRVDKLTGNQQFSIIFTRSEISSVMFEKYSFQ